VKEKPKSKYQNPGFRSEEKIDSIKKPKTEGKKDEKLVNH